MADEDVQQDLNKLDITDTQDEEIDWINLRATALERTKNATRDFCLFMRDLFVPEDAVMLAPEGGWPEINRESFAGLEKTDDAIEVLRFMSYLKYTSGNECYQILPDIGLADYRHPWLIKTLEEGRAQEVRWTIELYDTYLPYTISLVRVDSNDYRKHLVLDCRSGIVYWKDMDREEAGTKKYDRMEAEHHEDSVDDMETDHQMDDANGMGVNVTSSQDDDEWSGIGDDEFIEAELRRSAAWPVEEFFGMVKMRFTSMQQLPKTTTEVVSSDTDRKGIFKELKNIYEEHGWPNEYRKEDCIKKVEDFAWRKSCEACGKDPYSNPNEML